MLEDKEEVNIPEQSEGVKKDIEASKTLPTTQEAIEFYSQTRRKLLFVNNWGEISGTLSASFKLTDYRGNEVEREARVGDYFKIDLPGPGTKAGEGYDWVKVESIEESSQGETLDDCITIRVRPSQDPLNLKDSSIAHFLSDSATSNFVLLRKGNTVTAAVLGRNEKPNTKAESIIDKTRNTVVAAGAIAGVANLQWKALVNGLLGLK